MERNDPSSNSNEKGHSSKKNAEGTSRRIKNSKRKPSKRIISSEESSSDELVHTDESRNEQAQLNSCATIDEICQKESVWKLKIDRIRPSTSEPLKKGQTTKQNVEEDLSSKGKAYKRITSREKKFSGKMVISGSSRARPYPIYSRASSEDNSHIKAFKEMKRKRLSSESISKMYFTDKNVEEISQATQSSRRTYKNIDYCEDNSTEESRTDAYPPMDLSFSSTCGENEGQEWCTYIQLPPVIKRTETLSYKQWRKKEENSGEKITFGFYPSFGIKTDSRDDRLDAGEFLKESSISEVPPGCGNLSKSGISKPFSYWANISYVMRRFEADEEPESEHLPTCKLSKQYSVLIRSR